MNDEQLKQRIQYLIEHGGMLDDPMRETTRLARWAVGVSTVALVLGVIDLAM